ncbi:hypothetical protein ATY81_08610 [Rhizobium sp. R72]|nr:hypothetical protein ATY81_08610 [Rhizobium sp. R72]OWV97813.1 hypothetical protein ATY80_08610 [Rhizobium sp. R711]
MPRRFESRVVPVEEPVALAWGDLIALARRNGRSPPPQSPHDLSLATCNTKDFKSFGLDIIDPWNS